MKIKVSKVETKGLRFMSIRLNKIPTRVLVDTGVSYNFVYIYEAKRLELKTIKEGKLIKLMNGITSFSYYSSEYSMETRWRIREAPRVEPL